MRSGTITSRCRARRGFFMADVIIGLSLVALIGATLAIAVREHNKATKSLGDSRAAARIAEDVLTSLQARTTAPADAEANISVKRSPAPGAGTGMEWADVTVAYHGRTATLTGLVPAERGAP